MLRLLVGSFCWLMSVIETDEPADNGRWPAVAGDSAELTAPRRCRLAWPGWPRLAELTRLEFTICVMAADATVAQIVQSSFQANKCTATTEMADDAAAAAAAAAAATPPRRTGGASARRRAVAAVFYKSTSRFAKFR